jgi:hypothetical protein
MKANEGQRRHPMKTNEGQFVPPCRMIADGKRILGVVADKDYFLSVMNGICTLLPWCFRLL